MESFIELPAEVSTVTPTNHDVSFLLEGSFTGNLNTFPEVSAAINLAQANECEYFDSISSYDTEQIGKLLTDKTEDQQKAILLSIYLDFAGEGTSESIIENVLKKPYRDFFGRMPIWLSELNPFNISFFDTNVLKDMFDHDKEKFKLYTLSIREKLLHLSDEISARRFVEYVNNHPKLKTIYGLIGRNHLNMLNKLGEIVIQEGDYRLIKIATRDELIHVHLFGGEHGQMAHYELLANRAKQDGLIVPPTPVPSKNKMMDELIKLLLIRNARHESHEPDVSDEREIFDEPNVSDEKENELLINDKMKEIFVHWVMNNIKNHQINNKALFAWLTSGNGDKYIENYEHFCQFAATLKEQGYDTSYLPSEVEYNAVIKNTMRENFMHWATDNIENRQINNKALFAWLTSGNGDKYIKNYEHFCQFAATLKEQGYNTDPPSEVEYNAAIKFIKKAEKQKAFEGRMFKNPEYREVVSTSVEELVKMFEDWMSNYKHPVEHTENNNLALITWLDNDSGGRYVKDYQQFLELAKALYKNGYATQPPPTESEFNKGIEKFMETEKVLNNAKHHKYSNRL